MVASLCLKYHLCKSKTLTYLKGLWDGWLRNNSYEAQRSQKMHAMQCVSRVVC